MPRVFTLRIKQLSMSPALDDAAVLQHEDLIRRPSPVESRCAMTSVVRPSEIRLELGLDRFLRARVEGRRGLIKNQDRGFFKQRPRDRHALLLAAGELEARARRPMVS